MTVSIGSTLPLRFEDLPEGDGPRIELIDGSLHVTPLGDLRHQRVVSRLHSQLAVHAPRDLEVLPGANVLRRAATDRLLIPDVVVVDAQAPDGVHADPSDVFLVAEVESPSTRSADRLLKRELYAQWRIPHYWLLDPETSSLTRFALTPGRTYATADATGSWLDLVVDAAVWP